MAMASTSASALTSCSRAFSTLKSGGKAIARGKQAARAAAVAGNNIQASRIHSSRSLRYVPESSEFPDGQPRAQSTLFQPEPTKVANHLNSLMQGLQPPITSELAMRMVTHKGAVSQTTPPELSQHNARLSFLGELLRFWAVFWFVLLLSVQAAAYCVFTFQYSSTHTLPCSKKLDSKHQPRLQQAHHPQHQPLRNSASVCLTRP